MTALFRATSKFLQHVRSDLVRPHPFAAERVGFVSVRAAYARRALVLIAEGYHSVVDDDYINDSSVGAMMSQEAIRKALNVALLERVGIFHVHMHDHVGVPAFSCIDVREQHKFVPDFFKVRREMPHGALVLSEDRMTGQVWLAATEVTDIDEFHTVGSYTLIDIRRRKVRARDL